MSKRPLEVDDCADVKVKKEAVEKSFKTTPILNETEKNSLVRNEIMKKTEEIKSEKEDDMSVKLMQLQQQMQQVLNEKENMKIEVVMLTGDVTRLQHELDHSTAATKDAKLLAKKFDEQCGLLTYERDGLRSNVNTVNGEKKKMENEISYLRETMTLLVKKVDWYKAKYPSDQKMEPEGAGKNKGDQELKNRVAQLEKLLSDAEKEKQGTAEKLKRANIESEKLLDDNAKLVEELKDSLEAREKLNNNIDGMEESMKELRQGLNNAKVCIANLMKGKDATVDEMKKREVEINESMKELQGQYYQYQELLKSAKENVVTLKKEKEETISKLRRREDKIQEMEESLKKLSRKNDEYEQGLVCSNEYIVELKKEKHELISLLMKKEKDIMEIKAMPHHPFHRPPFLPQFPHSVNQSNSPMFPPSPSLRPSNSWITEQTPFFNGPHPHPHPHRPPPPNVMPVIMNALQGPNGPPNHYFFNG